MFEKVFRGFSKKIGFHVFLTLISTLVLVVSLLNLSLNKNLLSKVLSTFEICYPSSTVLLQILSHFWDSVSLPIQSRFVASFKLLLRFSTHPPFSCLLLSHFWDFLSSQDRFAASFKPCLIFYPASFKLFFASVLLVGCYLLGQFGPLELVTRTFKFSLYILPHRFLFLKFDYDVSTLNLCLKNGFRNVSEDVLRRFWKNCKDFVLHPVVEIHREISLRFIVS